MSSLTRIRWFAMQEWLFSSSHPQQDGFLSTLPGAQKPRWFLGQRLFSLVLRLFTGNPFICSVVRDFHRVWKYIYRGHLWTLPSGSMTRSSRVSADTHINFGNHLYAWELWMELFYVMISYCSARLTRVWLWILLEIGLYRGGQD